MDRPLHMLGAQEIHQAIEARKFSARDVAASCLERIALRNPQVLAFTASNPDRALADADAVDAEATPSALRGVPFAVKDVIDTCEYETQYGSVVYRGHYPRVDAGCVAVTRASGGILLGKLATCEFATQTPTVTRNPLALGHTPGGSSSGSAAAVADFMVPVAFGTQTTGSTVRPAAYCGVVGYKPSFGFFTRAGLKALSPSQDTITVFTRSVRDAAFFSFAYHGAGVGSAAAAPRIGVLRSGQWAHARPEMLAAIERFILRLKQVGATVVEVPLPLELEEMLAVQNTISAFEASHSLAHEFRHHREQLSPRLRARLLFAKDIGPQAYLRLQQRAVAARHAANALFDGVDVLLYPAAEGEAEAGLEDTGSPRYGALWSLLHLPTVSFPIASGPAGLPMGLQLIGRFGDDAGLLSATEFASAQGEFTLEDRA